MHYEGRNGLLVPRQKLIVGGHFLCALLRDGKTIDEWESPNLVVNQGLDHLLQTEFTQGQAVAQWYLAPFSNNYNPVGTDTAGSIVANAGEVTAYNGGNRLPYAAVEANQQVTNTAAPATFTFTQAGNIYGAFLISSAPKSSTAGILFAASPFGAAKAADIGDQLLITYQFTAQSA